MVELTHLQKMLVRLDHFFKDHDEDKKTSETNHLDVSKNRGTPKSSILIGFSIINHPF